MGKEGEVGKVSIFILSLIVKKYSPKEKKQKFFLHIKTECS